MEVNTQTVHAEEARANNVDWSSALITKDELKSDYNSTGSGKEANILFGKEGIRWIVVGSEDDGNLVFYSRDSLGNSQFYTSVARADAGINYVNSTLRETVQSCEKDESLFKSKEQNLMMITKLNDLNIEDKLYALYGIDYWQYHTPVYAGSSYDKAVNTAYWCDGDSWLRTVYLDDEEGWAKACLSGNARDIFTTDYDMSFGVSAAFKFDTDKLEFVASSEISETETDSFSEVTNSNKKYYLRLVDSDSKVAGSVSSVEDGKVSYTAAEGERLVVLVSANDTTYAYVKNGTGEKETLDLSEISNFPESESYDVKAWVEKKESDANSPLYYASDVVTSSFTKTETEEEEVVEEEIGGESQIDWGEVTVIPGIEGGWSDVYLTGEDVKNGGYNTSETGKTAYVKHYNLHYILDAGKDNKWIIAGVEDDGNMVLVTKEPVGSGSIFNQAEGYSSSYQNEYKDSTLHSNRRGSQDYSEGLSCDADSNLYAQGSQVTTKSSTVTELYYQLHANAEGDTVVYAGTGNDLPVASKHFPSSSFWTRTAAAGSDSQAYYVDGDTKSVKAGDCAEEKGVMAAMKTDNVKFLWREDPTKEGYIIAGNYGNLVSVPSIEDGKITYNLRNVDWEYLVIMLKTGGVIYQYVIPGATSSGEDKTIDIKDLAKLSGVDLTDSTEYSIKSFIFNRYYYNYEDEDYYYFRSCEVGDVVEYSYTPEENESDAASEEVSPILITKDELKSGDYNTTGSGKIAHILFGKEGIRWVVVGQEDDGNLIFYSRNFISDEAIYRCDEAGTVGRIEYSDSYLRSKIQEYQNSTDYFKTTEQGLMLSTTLSDQSVDVSDKLYPLYTDYIPGSGGGAGTVYAGGNYNKAVECIYCPLWEGDGDSTFLRSPYDNEGYNCVDFVATNIDTEEITAACVGYSDAPSASKCKVTAAFKLDTDKLKFVASSSISESETDSFSEVTNSDSQYCLRLENSSVTGSVSSVENGKVSYTAADDERLVVLVSANDTTYAYVKNGTGGKLNLNSIDGLTNGKEYSVKAWVEKKESDAHSPLYYASDVVTSSFTKTEVVEEEEDKTDGEDSKSDSEITESVTPNWKNECESIDTIKSDYNASGSGKIGYVKFGKSDIRWVIAGKESDGNLVLFSQDSLGKSTGGRYESSSGDYKNSDLQRYIQSLLENEEYFKKVETDLMLSTTVDTKYETVTDKLYPLYNESTTEGSCPELYAGAGNDIRICSDCWPSVDTWWLRRACGVDAIYIVKDKNLEIEIMYHDKTGGSYDTAAAFKLDSSKIRFMSGSSLPTDETKNFIKLSDTSDNTFCLRLKSDSIGSVSLTKDGEVTYTATDSDGRLVVLANDGTSTYCHIKASASGTNQVLDLNAIEGLTNGTEYSVKAWVEKKENDANSPLYYASDVVTSSFTKTEVVEEEETESVSDSGSISGSDSESSKADPVYIEPTNLTATYGQKLREVDLNEKSESNENSESTTPGTWKWDDGDVYVGEVGTNEFAATFIPDDTENYNTLGKLLEVKVLADTSGWGEKIEIEGSGHSIYVGSDGTLSAEVFPKSVVWVQQLLASSGKSNWYGLDNSDDRYRSGSKFSVKCLSKTENADEWNSYYDSLGDGASTCGTSVLLIGVTDPDGEEYSLLSDDEDSATLYIQLNSDTGDSEEVDHSDILVVTSSGAAQVSEAYYVDDVSYPGGSGNFTKLVLTSASSTKSSTTSTSSTDDETEEDTEEDTENSEDEGDLDETEVDQEDDNSYSTIGSSRSKNKNGDDDSTQDESSSKTLNDMQMILLVCISGVFIASVLLYVYLKKRNKK